MRESENHVFVFPTRKMPGRAFFEVPISPATEVYMQYVLQVEQTLSVRSEALIER
jgi:hypothetical protein